MINKYKFQLSDNSVIETQGKNINDAVDNYLDASFIYTTKDKETIKNRLIKSIVRVLGSNIK